MFGLGVLEIVVVAGVAALVFGPKKLSVSDGASVRLGFLMDSSEGFLQKKKKTIFKVLYGLSLLDYTGFFYIFHVLYIDFVGCWIGRRSWY